MFTWSTILQNFGKTHVADSKNKLYLSPSAQIDLKVPHFGLNSSFLKIFNIFTSDYLSCSINLPSFRKFLGVDSINNVYQFWTYVKIFCLVLNRKFSKSCKIRIFTIVYQQCPIILQNPENRFTEKNKAFDLLEPDWIKECLVWAQQPILGDIYLIPFCLLTISINYYCHFFPLQCPITFKILEKL